MKRQKREREREDLLSSQAEESLKPQRLPADIYMYQYENTYIVV
jgi:hypothetical protein